MISTILMDIDDTLLDLIYVQNGQWMKLQRK